MPTSPFLPQIQELQGRPSQIRNACILAHVDHGKTTLADALVASNGLISSRMAGKLLYLDSRPDEQERGITMKSSAVSLVHVHDQRASLINLIDSPGHVDFSSEVSTAVRLCDGAILVVDVVEGVQPQTQTVLAQAWREGIKPVLVLNKIDRLITQKKMAPLDAYVHLTRVLERVNAVIGELFAADVMRQDEDRPPEACSEPAAEEPDPGQEVVFDWSTGMDEADDSDLYFSPERGNVVFASAAEGWGFDLGTFARIYAQKLGFSERVLKRTLWGDYYVNLKAQKIFRGALSQAKKPLFVSLILDNVWNAYEAVRARHDKDKLTKIIQSLGLKIAPRDLKSEDPDQLIRAIFGQWLPLSAAVLSMVCAQLPAPDQLSEERVKKLMCSKGRKFETLPESTRALKEAFLACSDEPEAPVIVFVSKMFPVMRSQLPENRPKALTTEEMAARRERAKARIKSPDEGTPLSVESLQLNDTPAEAKDETTFLAFARVFSGELKPDQEVYVLGPKYDPEEALKLIQSGQAICSDEDNVKNSKSHVFKTKLRSLYLLLGRDLEPLDRVPCGNVVGIGGLEDFILKSGTLSSEPACPAFVEVTQSAVPILRVAIEPAKSSDMQKVVQGLHLLNQADANVQVQLTDKGEHILVTAGEVHLERCVRDLKETYAGVDISVSEPIVPFRETIVVPPKHDMLNEQFNDDNKMVANPNSNEEAALMEKLVVMSTPDKRCLIKVEAVPLSSEVIAILEKNVDLFRALDQESNESLSETILQVKNEVRAQLETALRDIVNDLDVDRIWCLGPKRCGPNLLLNGFNEHGSIWKKSNQPVCQYDSSILNGFQLATMAGPLCEEPMMGVAFIIHDIQIEGNPEISSSSGIHGPLSGQIVSTMKEGCRKAFQNHPQRLMAAMYSCDIQVQAEVLGKLFASLGKRHGKIVHEDMVAGSSTFVVTAHLPVIESFQFSHEILRQTSGLAMPQLVFSHWELIDVDPFWVPSSEEEILHYGEKADSENQARQYMNDVRKKKGLMIDEKIVEFAEKQRTLTKMK